MKPTPPVPLDPARLAMIEKYFENPGLRVLNTSSRAMASGLVGELIREIRRLTQVELIRDEIGGKS